MFTYILKSSYKRLKGLTIHNKNQASLGPPPPRPKPSEMPAEEAMSIYNSNVIYNSTLYVQLFITSALSQNCLIMIQKCITSRYKIQE